jgi:hypothetical protein
MQGAKDESSRPELKFVKSRDFRVPFSAGMLITLVGAYADTYYHLSGLAAKEGFFTPAHATLYGGVFIMLLSTILWRKKKLFLKGVSINRNVLSVGLFLMVAGGAWDFVYHSIHGFVDVVAWTPPHLTVTAGFVILMIAAVVQFGRRSGLFLKSALASSVLLFVALWATVIVLTA